jgi:hypothetical protein
VKKTTGPKWGLFSSIVPVTNYVYIIGAEKTVVNQLQEAVSIQDRTLCTERLIGTDPSTRALRCHTPKSKSKPGVVPLVIVAVDPPVHTADKAAGKRIAANLLSVALEIAGWSNIRILVVGISSDPSRQEKLIAGHCAAVLTLDQALEAIPTQLAKWLIYRK